MDKNSFLIKLSESDRTDVGKVDYSDQSAEQGVFTNVWELESEVNDGGFLQYFANSSGATAQHAPAALKTIGAKQCATIVEQALRAISKKPLPEDDDERQELIDSVNDKVQTRLEELDEEFQQYPDNPTELLFQYVKSHPKVFGPVLKSLA